MVSKKKANEIKEEKLKKPARNLSIKDGIFATGKVAFGDNYIQPLAIHINSSNFIVALLSAVISLLGPISESFGSKLIERKARKTIVLKTMMLELLVWLPIIALIILFYKGLALSFLPIALLLFFSFHVIFNRIKHPAWFSWVGDLVPEGRRGRWFAKRNLLIGFSSMFFAITSALILSYLTSIDQATIGFIILFSLAFLAKLICYFTLRKEYEPKIKLKKTDYFSFTDFIINAKTNNFGRYAIFKSVLGIGLGLSSAIFAIYIIRVLGYSYAQYMAIIIANMFFSIIFLRIWGVIADKYGNAKVIFISAILIPMIPLLFILHNSLLYFIFFTQLVSGLAWSGFMLAEGNFVYDNIRPEKRGFAISYLHLIDGLALFIGATTSALFMKYLTFNIYNIIVMLYIASALFRFIAVTAFLPKVEEVKKKRKLRNLHQLSHIIMRQTKPAIKEEFHEVYSMKKYFFSKR